MQTRIHIVTSSLTSSLGKYMRMLEGTENSRKRELETCFCFLCSVLQNGFGFSENNSVSLKPCLAL